MKIIHIDIDTLRADHLGCYGYHRATSPHIDALARRGVRFTRCYASDTPCLPSRTALTTGVFGMRSGVVNHGGVAADPYLEGSLRPFTNRLQEDSFAMQLRRAGLRTTTISTFAERHAAPHWLNGYNEMINIGRRGMESAHEVLPEALAWLDRQRGRDNWFLHVHLWDPHTPYRAPAAYGEPFAQSPLPAWLTDSVRARHWQGIGPHSAQEVTGFSADTTTQVRCPRQPVAMGSMTEVRRLFDGYDTGVLYADDHVGQLIAAVRAAGILDETVILVSSDHGENLGELNIYGDHQTADELTHRVPMILCFPGLAVPAGGLVQDALHYQFDITATLLELLGAGVPASWDGQGFAASLRAQQDVGRDHLILSHGAWTCQRAVRWQQWLCIRTYHDGYHGFPELMLFDVEADPHLQHDLATRHPQLVEHALAQLERWHGRMLQTCPSGVDPMATVLQEGGPYHVRGELPRYLERLQTTGRQDGARLLQRHQLAAATRSR